jgi:hypothetical protein
MGCDVLSPIALHIFTQFNLDTIHYEARGMWGELRTLGQGLVVWTGVHYVSVHGYQYMCVPATLWGVVMAPLTMAAPHCRGLVWLIDASSLSVIGIWAASGLLISGKIIGLMPNMLASSANTHNVGPK